MLLVDSALATEAETPPASSPRPWYEGAYRRAVIDMHIPDWDPQFLARFDPTEYVERLQTARAQSIVCYAQSHVGLFNYPTQVGRQHAGWNGRNALGELTDRCRARGIAVVAYCSLVFDRYCADEHPDWRMVDSSGRAVDAGRHGFVCPNSPYRDYVHRFTKELCERFDIDGVRFDMTFWPRFCYCTWCRKRFRDEVGGEIPTVVDWFDEKWAAFANARSRWLVEFANVATETVRKIRPHASVEHQSSTYLGDWRNGVSADLVWQNDFLQGDFYGNQWQGSFARKVLERLSPKRPFGYETCVAVSLQDHTAIKPRSLLKAKAASAVADAGAFVYIDAVDPIGTVNPVPHARMGAVFDELEPYYAELGGRRVHDVVAYFGQASKVDFAENGRAVQELAGGDTHTSSCMNAAARLLGAHVPYGVVDERSLAALSDAKVLVLSNVNRLDDQACDAIRAWVAAGGRLYASGTTSLATPGGRLRSTFGLADVLGVDYHEGRWTPWKHYLSPTPLGADWFGDFTPQRPAYCNGPSVVIDLRGDAVPLATTTLPWQTGNPRRFSSIHSDPPWQATARPELVSNQYGQGRTVYAATPLENFDSLAPTFLAAIRSLAGEFSFAAEGPDCVELTMFQQPDRSRYLLSLVNFQAELLQRGEENIPVFDLPVTVRVPQQVKRVRETPSNRDLPFRHAGSAIEFTVPCVETLTMVAIHVDFNPVLNREDAS